MAGKDERRVEAGPQAPPERTAPGGGSRDHGARPFRLLGEECLCHGYLTATCETSSTPVQSLITMFFTDLPYSRL